MSLMLWKVYFTFYFLPLLYFRYLVGRGDDTSRCWQITKIKVNIIPYLKNCCCACCWIYVLQLEQRSGRCICCTDSQLKCVYHILFKTLFQSILQEGWRAPHCWGGGTREVKILIMASPLSILTRYREHDKQINHKPIHVTYRVRASLRSGKGVRRYSHCHFSPCPQFYFTHIKSLFFLS